MDPTNLLNTLLNAIKGIGVILILLGTLIAFLWKAAFYFNLALGLVITVIITYSVNTIGADVETTAIIFFIGLICSLVVAAIGGILCLLEGFLLSSLGIWVLWISGSSPSILSFDIARSISESAVVSLVPTGIAAYLGGKTFSIIALRRSARGRSSTEKRQVDNEPIYVEILPEDPESSTNNKPPINSEKAEPDLQIKRRILGYIKAYREFQLEAAAQRFGLNRKQVEDIILDLLAEEKIKGFIDSKTDKFTSETDK